MNKLFSTLALRPTQKHTVFMGVTHWRLGSKRPLLWVDNSFAYYNEFFNLPRQCTWGKLFWKRPMF